MRSRCWKGIRLSKAIWALEEIASALDYLHKRNLFHLDVKPENVLFNEQGEAKLSDLDSWAYRKSLRIERWPTYGNSFIHNIPSGRGWAKITVPIANNARELDWLQFCLMAYEILTGTFSSLQDHLSAREE